MRRRQRQRRRPRPASRQLPYGSITARRRPRRRRLRQLRRQRRRWRRYRRRRGNVELRLRDWLRSVHRPTELQHRRRHGAGFEQSARV
ncbi:MAG: hypothetical protein MJE66_00840 [Proteobacteria bacterium]|nr:hypothetical protein [Pseudomonadota bacterium]